MTSMSPITCKSTMCRSRTYSWNDYGEEKTTSWLARSRTKSVSNRFVYKKRSESSTNFNDLLNMKIILNLIIVLRKVSIKLRLYYDLRKKYENFTKMLRFTKILRKCYDLRKFYESVTKCYENFTKVTKMLRKLRKCYNKITLHWSFQLPRMIQTSPTVTVIRSSLLKMTRITNLLAQNACSRATRWQCSSALWRTNSFITVMLTGPPSKSKMWNWICQILPAGFRVMSLTIQILYHGRIRIVFF